MFDDELESFKRIDLRAYAASIGYQLDKRDSSRGSSVMRQPATNDKIIIGIDKSDGHYVYWSVRDDGDKGTVIDFIQRRERVSLGVVRKILRPWIGAPPVAVPSFTPLHATSKDRIRVQALFAKMQDAQHHPYLERERALPATLLGSERFAGRIRNDDRGNAIFPHFDAEGICGYEIKNKGFTGFAAGGSKGLWHSHELPDDNRLVFSESSIDALSHAVLFPDLHARYASIGGKLNPIQPELIRAAIARMPDGSEVVGAMDADTDGAKLADVVRQAVELTGRDDLRFVVQLPQMAKDWNDQLRERQQALSLPAAPLSVLKAG